MNIESKTMQSLIAQANTMFKDLFPICRSLTGDGVRQTYQYLQNIAPFDVKEVPSGTVCYDWTVPDEWNINDAYIQDAAGKKIVSFKDSNIHVVNYSVSVNATMYFDQLKEHLHYLPNLPDAIPYRTSYYKRDWGFCLTHQQFKSLDTNGTYKVVIDATLKPGSLSYGEKILKGSSNKEYIISTYSCHPSLANDNLSGPILWTLLLKAISQRTLRHSYRFIIIPETIGAIVYLNKNEAAMKNSAGGFVITTVAGPGKFGYKHSFMSDHQVDQVAHQVLKESGEAYVTYPFDIAGSDERQFSAPYFRIPTGTIAKDKYYEYDYYHTSKDNLDFVSGESLVKTLQLYLSAIDMLEMDGTYTSRHPFCEPMLGKRGLYPQLGGSLKQKVADEPVLANQVDMMLWLMFYADGKHSLLQIAKETGFKVKDLFQVASLLEQHQLLEKV